MKKAEELHLLETLNRLWQEISIDIIGLLLRLNNKNTIVVIMNQFSKIIRLKAMTTIVSLEEIAKIYQDKIWKLYRMPQKILSDREPQFALRFMEDLTKTLGMKRILSMVYYPQTNRQMKQINQEVEAFLQHYVNYQQDNQTEQLSTAEFQYNDKKYATTEHTPFKLNFGRHLQKGNLTVKMKLPKLEDFLEGLQRSQEVAKKSIEVAKKAMKKQFDIKRHNSQRLKVGEICGWKPRISNQIDLQKSWTRYRPFRISKNIGQETFQLDLPEEWAIHNVFNKDLLT